MTTPPYEFRTTDDPCPLCGRPWHGLPKDLCPSVFGRPDARGCDLTASLSEQVSQANRDANRASDRKESA